MSIYRIDKFTVPAHAREEFLQRLLQTREILRSQDGFVRDYLLEQDATDGIGHMLTFVEWESAEVVPRVAATVAERHKALGFDRYEMYDRLGIIAEFGTYRPLEPQ